MIQTWPWRLTSNWQTVVSIRHYKEVMWCRSGSYALFSRFGVRKMFQRDFCLNADEEREGVDERGMQKIFTPTSCQRCMCIRQWAGIQKKPEKCKNNRNSMSTGHQRSALSSPHYHNSGKSGNALKPPVLKKVCIFQYSVLIMQHFLGKVFSTMLLKQQ